MIYWDHLETIVNWAKDHVTSTLYVCWAVQAGLKMLYGLPKRTRKQKLSGVYWHDTQKENSHHPLLRGFDDAFLAPHSRFADFPPEFLTEQTDLDLLVTSQEAGTYLAATKDKRHVFVTGHPEYDHLTLHHEYVRDTGEGMEPAVPVNYYPDNNPENPPRVSWRSHGHLLFSNWLNYCVYQQTPYDLDHFSEEYFTRMKINNPYIQKRPAFAGRFHIRCGYMLRSITLAFSIILVMVEPWIRIENTTTA